MITRRTLDGAQRRMHNPPVMRIFAATSSDDIDVVRRLFRAYAAEVDAPPCFAAFDEEVAGLPGEYAAPAGALWLAADATGPAGCVALRRLADGSGEMKRLYVRPPYRRGGLARELVRRVIAHARAQGCPRLVLDTLPSMHAATALYASLGFVETGPYSPAPTPGARCFALSLS